MGEGRGAGDGHSRVEKLCCLMCRHVQDRLRSGKLRRFVHMNDNIKNL